METIDKMKFTFALTLSAMPHVSVEVDDSVLQWDDRNGRSIQLPFSDSKEDGCHFRIKFADKQNGLPIYTSETYYKPIGQLLSTFVYALIKRAFPSASWPCNRNGQAA